MLVFTKRTLIVALALFAVACGSSNNPNATDCTLCEGLSLQDSLAQFFTAQNCSDMGTGVPPALNCACDLDGSNETAMTFVYEREGSFVCQQ